MKNYNWATLGCGVIANELAQAMAAHGRTLYGVANRTHSKAVDFAKKYGVTKVYDQIEDIFSDPEVDIIYISTPHNTHIKYLRQALAAGKHVLCEKSITLNAAELTEAKQLAEKLGMSDKSVSKWERGVCLPDVSVYKELCSILGISLNEFLAGEDIAQENMIQKSETNIIEVIRDNIDKQKCLKVMKCILLVISICAVSVIGFTIYRLKKPQNYISPVAKDSIEMQTAELLAGPDGAFVYKFITTDEYKKLRLHIYRYESGKLSDQDKVEMGFEDIGSPKSGEIVMVPDFDNYVIKLIISGGGSRLSTEIPILENVENREYYGRTATEIKNVIDIKYNKQQPLIAFVYDNDEMNVPTLDDFINNQTDYLSKNDYVYYVAFEFCK